jgi:hypothetical protein
MRRKPFADWRHRHRDDKRTEEEGEKRDHPV